MRRGWKWAGVPMALALASLSHGGSPEFRLLRYAERVYGDASSGEIALVQGTEPTVPEIQQPPDFGLPSLGQSGPSGGLGDLASLASLRRELGGPRLSTSRETTLNTPQQVEAQEQFTGRPDTGTSATAPVDIVPASSFNLASVPDAGETIVATPTNQTVKARRRSPLGFDPRIRGYYFGQVFTTLDGGYTMPAREDLDGLLSKIDPFLIGNVQVISGPYGLRHGSGFAFVNVDTIPTPRYECPENHLRLGTHVRTNGGQTYNTATLYGGGRRTGYYINTGYRKGSDFRAGNGLAIPSSYEAFNLMGAVGTDLDDDTRMITRFTHVNEGETEYAGQFFDIDDLKYYGINHSIIHRNRESGFGYRVDGWFNGSVFDGDTRNAGKRRSDFAVLQRVDSALSDGVFTPGPDSGDGFTGDVEGRLIAYGFRAGVTQEFGEGTSVGAGADFRYLRQRIRERYDLSDFGMNDINANLPTGELFDPGIYSEGSWAITPFWRLAGGARVAFVSTQARRSQVLPDSNFREPQFPPEIGDINRDLSASDVLTSFYVTNDVELDPNWRGRLGAGYAERVPNLFDRYADGIFLATIQNGFSKIVGNPELDKERNWQVDVRLDADYEFVRGRIGGFHAWITDYVTYAANEIIDPSGARVLQSLNTDLATLTGFEAYGEADLTPGVQCFGSLAYLDGRDREINAPLPGIYPLEGRLGLRWVDLADANRWGLEWGWRIVDNQGRLGTLRSAGEGLPPVPVETATPAFAVSYLRGYARPTDRMSLTAGIENLFDRTYREHLDLRLPSDGMFGNTFVLSPGFTPYFGVEVDY